jgi:hypothetical protein
VTHSKKDNDSAQFHPAEIGCSAKRQFLPPVAFQFALVFDRNSKSIHN